MGYRRNNTFIYNSRNSKDLIVASAFGTPQLTIYNSRNSKDLIVKIKDLADDG